jgi:hypothetical protein
MLTLTDHDTEAEDSALITGSRQLPGYMPLL